MTALQIAALKRLGKGNKILVLDRSGGSTAKAVARALAERGFGRVFVIKGGFQVGRSVLMHSATGLRCRAVATC